MYMVKISDDKIASLSEHVEKGLKYLGKAMQCIEEMKEGEMFGERDERMSFGERRGYGRRDVMEPEEDVVRGMRGRGRYY